MQVLKRLFCCVAMATLAVSGWAQGAKSQGRVAFAKALQSVSSKMTQEEVRTLLGEPDDVLNEAEAYLMGLAEMGTDVRAVWAYGTNGHLKFPTLGMVAFQGKNASTPFPILGSTKWEPIPDGTIEEEELRALLRKMDHGLYGNRLYEHTQSDPLSVVRIANALIPLGKQKAALAIREFARVEPFAANDLTVYNAVRSAFTFEAGANLPKLADYRNVPASGDQITKWFNTEPFMLVNDIPVHLAPDVLATLQNDFLKDLADAVERYGTPRDSLLRPSGLLATREKVESTPLWPDAVKVATEPYESSASAWADAKLRLQLLLMARNALKFDPHLLTKTDEKGVTTYSWGQDVDELAGKPLEWDEKSQSFVLSGAAPIPSEPENVTTQTWNVPGAEAYELRVHVIRSGKYLLTNARWNEPPEGTESMKLKILSGDGQSSLQEIKFPVPEDHGSFGRYQISDSTSEWEGRKWREVGMLLRLEQVPALYIEIEKGEAVRKSPIYKFQ